mmetsp:Transcript_7251/g.15649  ORF Transcript_7251/g.15649 Transcript_7251/m.15649 type:complete len:734 (-) Transcript_7251:36-2237(-)
MQAHWRASLCRAIRLKKQRNAALRIQAMFRVWRLSRHGPLALAHRRRAAIPRMQGLARGFFGRRYVHRMHEAARCFQRRVRLHQFRRAMAAFRYVVLFNQRVWRGRSCRIQTMTRFANLMKMPGYWQGVALREKRMPRMQQAAMEIQRIHRGNVNREGLIAVCIQTIQVQAWWRMSMQRRRYKHIMEARYKLRGLIYRWRWKKELTAHLMVMAKLKRVVQLTLPKRRHRRIRLRGVQIQQAQRGVRCRRQLALQSKSAAIIQAHVRGRKTRTATRKKLRALVVLQSWIAALRHQSLARRRLEAAVIIEAMARVWLTRRLVKSWSAAATNIARIYRGFARRTRLRRRQAASTLIGRKMASQAEALKLRRLRMATRRIQAAWRRHLSWHRELQRNQAVSRLAASWRRCSGMRRYQSVRAAGSRLVCAMWMWRHMRLRRMQREAATRLCAAWRAHCCRVNVQELKAAALKIRKWWRDHAACTSSTSTMLEMLLEKRKIMDDIQTGPAIVIQRRARIWLGKRRGMQLLRRAFITLQARFRTWRPKREVALLRQVLGPNLGRLPSQLMALAPDKQGRLTKHRAFRAKEKPVRATCRILRIKVLPAELRMDLEDAVAPLQAFVKHRVRIGKFVRIQSAVRGWELREKMFFKATAALVIQAGARGMLARRRVRQIKALTAELALLPEAEDFAEDAEPPARADPAEAAEASTAAALAGESAAAPALPVPSPDGGDEGPPPA